MKNSALTDSERELIRRRAVQSEKDIPFFNFMKYWNTSEKVLFGLIATLIWAAFAVATIGAFMGSGVVPGTIMLTCLLGVPLSTRAGAYSYEQNELVKKHRHNYASYWNSAVTFRRRFASDNDKEPTTTVSGFTVPSTVDEIWQRAQACKRSPEELTILADRCAFLTLKLMDLPDEDAFVDDTERAAVQKQLDDLYAETINLANAIVEHESNIKSLDARIVAQRIVHEAEAWNQLRNADDFAPAVKLTKAIKDSSQQIKDVTRQIKTR